MVTSPSVDTQVQRIRKHVQQARAHGHLQSSAACHEARAATEGMLRTLADVFEVSIPRRQRAPLTIDNLKTPLRHAGVLDQRMEDLVSTIQRFANRAAHFQSEPELSINPHDASLTLEALAQLHTLFEARLSTRAGPLGGGKSPEQINDSPKPTPSKSTRAAWWPWLVAPLAFAAGLAFAFWLLLAVLHLAIGDTPRKPPANREPVDLTAADLEALLEDEQTTSAGEDGTAEQGHHEVPTLAIAPIRQAIAAIRLQENLDEAWLSDMDCDDLNHVRNWLWASHGYVFSDDLIQTRFDEADGYRADPNVTRQSIERQLTPTDRKSRTILNGRLKAQGCRCPGLRPKAPCPN